ncbi:chromate transporter [Bacillus sp. EAC]|uniref:chromate transporter n=1 Tax=Bacillus sp. EAC TaxID=1978338 RepID=UPI00211B0D90|nr:chromate transporter [Bacillus sp. EAC]
MILWELFKMFFILGLASFGGGYSIISVLGLDVMKNHWMSSQDLTNIVAVAGMSPGPIATNSAILVGNHINGFLGAIVSALGMLLPSFLLVLIVATCFQKLNQNPIVQSIFYGLRPIVTSLILFAAIKFALSNDLISTNLSFKSIGLFLIFILSFISLGKFKCHPALILLISGIVGSIFYA